MPLLFQNKEKSNAWYSKDLHFAPHLHQAVELGVIEEGESIFHVEGKTYRAERGDFFIIFPNLIHSYESTASKTLLCIITTLDLKAFDTELSAYTPENPVLKRGHWEATGLKSLLNLFSADMERETEAVLQGYYQAIVGKCLPLLSLSPRKKQDSDELRQILAYIHEHRTEEITRKQLSRAAGVSEGVISRMFSDTLKMSLPEYLNSVRLADAVTLLRQTKHSVTEIAELAGFGSIRSFNRAFSEHFHISPTEYRNQKT